MPQCFKIVQKVAFNIASEASYVYILSGQKLIKNAKNDPFWRVFAYSQTVLPDRSLLKGRKLVENAKIEKSKMRHFMEFSNTVFLLCKICNSIMRKMFWFKFLCEIIHNNQVSKLLTIADTDYSWALLSKCCWILLNLAEYYWALLRFTKNY